MRWRRPSRRRCWTRCSRCSGPTEAQPAFPPTGSAPSFLDPKREREPRTRPSFSWPVGFRAYLPNLPVGQPSVPTAGPSTQTAARQALRRDATRVGVAGVTRRAVRVLRAVGDLGAVRVLPAEAVPVHVVATEPLPERPAPNAALA